MGSWFLELGLVGPRTKSEKSRVLLRPGTHSKAPGWVPKMEVDSWKTPHAKQARGRIYSERRSPNRRSLLVGPAKRGPIGNAILHEMYSNRDLLLGFRAMSDAGVGLRWGIDGIDRPILVL